MFVSESIQPEKGSFESAGPAQGLAALPRAFGWRGDRYEIVELLSREKISVVESFSGERYFRRERFTVRLDTGQIAVIDFDRQTRAKPGSKQAKQRWWLYTIENGEDERQ